MALVLTIDGTDRTSYLVVKSLRISDELNSRNTCSFRLIDTAGSYRPNIGEVITAVDGATTYFAGTIDSIDETAFDANNTQIFSVKCVDYNQIADRHLVAREYSSQAVGTIVDDINTQDLAGEGITAPGGLSGSGPTITKAIFNYQTVAAAYDELATLTGYYWNIDYSKNLVFQSRTDSVAPFSIADSSDNYLANSLRVQRTRAQYRNKQYIRAGHDLTDSRTESFVGDGTRKTFTLNFPAGTTPTITVDSISKTVGIRGVDTGKNWYWNKGDPAITQDDGDSAIGAGNTLEVTYQGLFPIIEQAIDDIEVTNRKNVEGGTGIYEHIEDDPNINLDDLAHEKATGLLRRYGVIPEIVTYETDTAGLQAGQLQTITLTRFGIDDQYLLESVESFDLNGSTIRYRVKAVSGEALGGWHVFFQRLAQSGRKFVIRDNEVLLLLRAFTEGVSFSDSFSSSSAAPETRAGYATVGFSEVG